MKPEDIQNKKILLSVLNWGMGHVSRSISIVQQLLNQNNKLFIACSENQRVIFNSYFPEINYINHCDYPFQFKGNGNFEKDLLLSSYKLYKRLKKEKIEVAEMVFTHTIDLVISDHRYGFITEKCPSIFITHQLNLPIKWYSKWVDYIHKNLLKKFNHIWILDTPTSKFAGKLSVNHHFKNAYYIGIHSRFSLYPKEEIKTETVVIVSGPEPYAQQFFEEQIKSATSKNEKTIIITPRNYRNPLPYNNNIEIKQSINWKEIDSIILKAKKIISRAGYSTIMDIQIVGCNSELTPTPKQSEQAYLEIINKKIHNYIKNIP
jgi:uncharacterized protein (TIGR00661 family)